MGVYGHAARTSTTTSEFTYTLVGSAEADPVNHRLSNESPVGQAILGKKVGDDGHRARSRGSMRYEVVSIEAY